MFAVFMLICTGISLVVHLAYNFATKCKGHYTALIALITNLATALLGLALAIDQGRIVSGMIIMFVNSILAGVSLDRLLLKDPADKTEEN